MALRFSPTRGAGSVSLNSYLRGPQGDAATIAVGTVASGNAGSTPTVSNSGTAIEATFDFTIPRGADAGMRYSFESSTTMAAPASGGFRLNNATLSSVTAIAVNATNADSIDVSDFIATWDDSTNATKGTLVVRKEGSGVVLGVFTIGTVTDNTTWLQVALTYVSGSGSFAAADKAYLTANLIGDKGTNGTVAISGTPSANQLATWFNSTTIQGVSITGLVKGNGASAPAAATAGTDYYAPGSTDVAVADGGTGASTAAGAATNLGLGTGDSPQFTAVNIGNASDTTVGRTSAGDINVEGNLIYRAGGTDVPVTDGGTGSSTAAGALTNLTARGQGKETIFIPAAAMVSRSTNGPSSGSVELSTNKIMVKSLDFDTTTQEFAQFSVWFPKSWNLGTVTFQASFSQLTTAAGGVTFGLAGVAVSSGDDLDVALGTAQTSNATAGTLNKEYQTAESSAITIAGTPAAGDRVIFQVNRTVADASDTLAQDARLHGIRLCFTTNAATDA